MDTSNAFLVPYVGLKAEFEQRKNELTRAFEAIGSSAGYVLRDEVSQFETSIADMLGVGYAIGVNSGTDALFLALKALNIGPGDEVITVAHTFVATLAAVVHCGAKPILIDIADDFNMAADKLEQVLSGATKVIIPVHMNGRCCNMSAILAVAEKYGLHVIEDAAQSLGAHIDGRHAGSFGVANAFSLHPMKNLHCYGDGGVITTNSASLAEQLKVLRNHGQNATKALISFGFNSRLDNLQAALLNVNFKYFADDVKRRRELAGRYHQGLGSVSGIKLPQPPEDSGYFDTFSSFPILSEDRDLLLKYLQAKGVECFIHWETPLHHNQYLNLGNIELPMTERVSREVLSLPIHPFLDNDQCDYVITAVREFFDGY
ncbi:DegT/DnrJ/EryC1/StrS family aminotransferase [Methylomonas albis]|uniref:DegT/DnrJ/EryC1/StrS family aminotransferase n=1 Tax=Methylomonas albis TaxID=1854563 RepID=A0ABR9CWH6_9GAMM|nr:DegT/DnrJ/EryC1/StrS family aminotransferase [Methylomonas albis]MBD9355060.1 DegT/DnrJ/EryC1/StrS family aminotransferase [Methylomonas albis]